MRYVSNACILVFMLLLVGWMVIITGSYTRDGDETETAPPQQASPVGTWVLDKEESTAEFRRMLEDEDEELDEYMRGMLEMYIETIHESSSTLIIAEDGTATMSASHEGETMTMTFRWALQGATLTMTVMIEGEEETTDCEFTGDTILMGPPEGGFQITSVFRRE